MLRDFGIVFYLDGSIRLKTSDIKTFFDTSKRMGGGALVLKTSHSIFAATDHRTYSFMPVDIEKAKHTMMFGAGALFLFNTKTIRHGIMWWCVLCSLERWCMAPFSSSFSCNFSDDQWTRWGHFHRFDQSVINIMFSNKFNYNSTIYVASEQNVLTIRNSTNMFKLKTYNN